MSLDNYKQLRKYINNTNPDLKLVVRAITLLFELHDECIHEIEKIDYNNSKKKYLSFLGNRELTDLIYPDELEKAEELNRPVEIFEQYSIQLQHIKCTLEALFYLVKDFSIDEILSNICDLEWIMKHEILTKWFWMIEQQKEIKNNKSFNRPYLCEVGGNIKRKTLDREFHTYLIFAQSYNKKRNDEILICSKQKRPDFVVYDSYKNKIGIEITEALPDSAIVKERKQFEILFNRLREDFGDFKVTISFYKRPNWLILVNEYEFLKEWLYQLLLKDMRNGTFENDELDISINIRENKERLFLIDASGDESGLPFVGDIIEQRVTELILSAIKKKLKKDYSKPIVLVVYENTGHFATRYDNVIKRCLSDEVIKSQTKFSEIWIATDQEAFLLN